MEEEDDEEIPGEIFWLLEHKKKTIQPHKEPLEVINLGLKITRRRSRLGTTLSRC